MAAFNLMFGFDWNSRAMFGASSIVQLQVSLSEALDGDATRMASFYGEINEGDTLDVSFVDITGDNALELELITAVVVFSGAQRSQSDVASPLATRYLAEAGVNLGASRTLTDNQAYNVQNAPTWTLGQASVINSGTFAFSGSILVDDPATGVLKTYAVDPEMQVGPFVTLADRS